VTEEAVPQRTIPALPADIDGQPVTWRRWEAACSWITHIDLSCEQCAHPGPPMLTFGSIPHPGKDDHALLSYQASRCPACQETRIYRRTPRRYGPPGIYLTEVGYIPPRTLEA